jgi:dolichyl-phosphate beta-glucosyltransferase
MTATSLTIVLPAYNEEARLGPALDELFGYLRRGGRGRAGLPGPEALPHELTVLVVDDGSSDGTAALVQARPEATDPGDGPRLQLLSVPHGGKGAAVRAGVIAATSEIVIFADADMATPPDQLPLLTTALDSYEVALGSRIQPDGRDMRRSQPGYRRFLGKVFHALASAWVAGPVKDTQCGFKGFRGPVGRDLFSMQKVTSIVFDVEVIYLARKRGYSMTIVPIEWSDRHVSRMVPRFGLALRVLWDLFRIPLVHRRLPRRPAGA